MLFFIIASFKLWKLTSYFATISKADCLTVDLCVYRVAVDEDILI